jgi:hypothetical protein
MRRMVVAGVALALVAGACGSGSASGGAKSARGDAAEVSTVRLVSSAADAATRARSARISGEVGIGIGGKTATVPIEGVVDFADNAVEMKMSLAGLTGGQQSGEVEIRMVDGAMYMNLGSILGGQAGVLGGKPWVSVATGENAAQGGTQNPADILGSLRGAGDVRLVGHGTVNGVEADHYRADIDVARAMDKLPAAQRDQARAGMKILGSTFPMDVWIDQDGLPVRVGLDLTAKLGMHVSEHLDFSDWGAPVTVEAPPADQVQSMADAQSGLGGSASAGAL